MQIHYSFVRSSIYSMTRACNNKYSMNSIESILKYLIWENDFRNGKRLIEIRAKIRMNDCKK